MRFLALALALCLVSLQTLAATLRKTIEASGVHGGLVVVVGCDNPAQVAALSRLPSRVVQAIDTDAVKEVASWITPVPGGVGPVTVGILMRNATVAHRRQIEAGWI